VKVTITDHGGGIRAEVLPMIFDPYFSTKQRGERKGMGLGLTVAHSVMQQHRGAITVASEVGVGTTFHLYLPAIVSAVREDVPTAKEPEVPPVTESPATGRILVMDDEDAVRNIAGVLLRHLGHDVELAENGEKAVDLYRQALDIGRPFDGVILDLTVRGGMGAAQTIKALLQIDPAVKAVVSSAYADDPVMTDYERYGFRGAIVKPWLTRDMKETLVLVLGS
jgi:CheY-like chemotaxis protein